MLRYAFVALALAAVTSVHCASRFDEDTIILDGRNSSPGQQCKNRGFGGVCRSSDPSERCLHLRCADTQRFDIPYPNDLGPALQGTQCGDNKVCIAGICTVDPDPPKNPLEFDDFQYGCSIPW